MLLKSICLLVLIVALCLLTVFQDRIKRSRWLYVVMTILYLGLLLWFTIIRRDRVQFPDSVVPFSSCWQITQVRWYGNGEYIFRAIIGNVLLFVPIGIIISNINNLQHPFFLSGLIGLILSSIIESVQYLMSLGVFEIDDIIFNTWGSLIGCSIATIIITKHKKKKQNSIIMCMPAIILIGLMFLICIVPILKELIILIKQG